MKYLSLVLLVIMCCFSSLTKAQHPRYYGLDAAFGTNGNQNVYGFSLLRTHALGKEHRIFMSYGLRFSSFSGNDMEFYSAPKDYYLIPEKTDTLFMANGGQNNLALFIGASYKYKNRFLFGFNIDALGYTFGNSQTGLFNPDGANIEDQASPKQASVLLVGANDIGMLKAEFELGVIITDYFVVRAGLSNMFLEYKTSKELQMGNDRFRAASSVGFLGVRFYL